MKAVIQTQFLENYGAHDWDGEGVCPQRWKPKGGDTYIIDVSIRQAQDADFWKHVMSMIEYSTDYAREYIVGETIVDDIDFKESDHCPEWDSPTYLEWNDDGRLRATRTSSWTSGATPKSRVTAKPTSSVRVVSRPITCLSTS